MGSGQAGEVQILLYLGLYILVASTLLSLFAVQVNMTAGMVNPSISSPTNNCNGILCLSDELSKFIYVFSSLLVWYVPPTIIPFEIQVPFIIFPKVGIVGIIITILMRLIP